MCTCLWAACERPCAIFGSFSRLWQPGMIPNRVSWPGAGLSRFLSCQPETIAEKIFSKQKVYDFFLLTSFLCCVVGLLTFTFYPTLFQSKKLLVGIMALLPTSLCCRCSGQHLDDDDCRHDGILSRAGGRQTDDLGPISICPGLDDLLGLLGRLVCLRSGSV